MLSATLSPLKRQNNALSPTMKIESMKPNSPTLKVSRIDDPSESSPGTSYLKRSGGRVLSPSIKEELGLKDISITSHEYSVPVTPQSKPQNLDVDISVASINISVAGKSQKPQSHKRNRLNKSPHKNRVKGKSDRSCSSVFSETEDSFIAQVEKEVQIRAQREVYLDDSDEDDFLMPKGLKAKIIQEKEKQARILRELKRQEEEDVNRKLRIEVVKRDLPVVEKAITTTSSWNNPDASKLGKLMKKYEAESESDDDNEDDIDPFQKQIVDFGDGVKARRNIEFSYTSQGDRLMKVVSLNVTGMEEETKRKSKKNNNYYKAPRKVEYNCERNFGTDKI